MATKNTGAATRALLREAITILIEEEGEVDEPVAGIKFTWGRPKFTRDDEDGYIIVRYPVIVTYYDGDEPHAISTYVDYGVGSSSASAHLRHVGATEGFYSVVDPETHAVLPTNHDALDDDTFYEMEGALAEEAESDESLRSAWEDVRDLATDV